MSGVWRTDGADDGGLKMIWSCCTGAFEYEGRKDGSGLTFRRDFERRYEDSWRADAALSASKHCDLPERSLATGLRSNLASIAEKELHCIRPEAVVLSIIFDDVLLTKSRAEQGSNARCTKLHKPAWAAETDPMTASERGARQRRRTEAEPGRDNLKH